jgi:hypothetical protein
MAKQLRPLVAFLAAMTVHGQSIDAAAAKVREAEAALREAQESYRKALLEQAAALRAQADAIEAKARGAVTPVAGNVSVGAPSVRILPVAAVAAPAPAPVSAAAPQPPVPPTPAPTPAQPKPPLDADKEGEWEARAVLGFHQAGASSAESSQNYFFDFYIMRGLGNHAKVYDSRVNVWGNVRIASAPQQVDSSVANFVANFSTGAGGLKVNELAQSGEFLTGLGLRLKNWKQGDRIRMLETVGYWGANGAFSEPGTRSQIYKVPAAGTPQRGVFERNFGEDIRRLTGGAIPEYVGFVPPDRERFYRQYGFGMRLSTFELNRPYSPPATYMFTLGRDQLITEGVYKDVVARADVFYPLPLGKEDGRFKFLFLFGTANLRLTKPKPLDVIALEPAGSAVQLYSPTVAVISRPSSRDTYRIGMGVDFVNLLNSWRVTRSGAGATR